MWTRSLLKENAKRALSGRYGRGLVVCLIPSLLGFICSELMFSLGLPVAMFSGLGLDWSQPSALTAEALMPMFLSAYLVMMVVVLVWGIFVSNVIAVGSCRYFMESRQSPAPIGTLFSAFRKPYLNVVKVYLLVDLKIVGIMLLFAIPACILGVLSMSVPLAVVLLLLSFLPATYWMYCYMMVPYLLAENPYLTTRRAMELSKQMMYGEKLRFFVLQLSFFGWALLCSLLGWTLALILPLLASFCTLPLLPYMKATYAEFYAAMRAKALSQGMSTPEELGGFVRHDSSTAAL